MSDDYISGHLRPGGHAPGGLRANPDMRVHQHRLPETYAEFAALPAAGPEEIAAVAQLLGLVGHAVDNGDTELLDEVFAPGAPRPAVATPAEPLPSHHTVNTQVRRHDGGLVAWSRLVTIAGDGSVATADVIDTLAEGPEGREGMRVTRRTLHPRHGGPQTITDGTTPW